MTTSILTKRLRKFLITGDKSTNPNRDRKVIRDRVIAGMIDLYLLSQRWPQEEMDKVFPPLYAERIREYYRDPEFYSEDDMKFLKGEDYTNDDRFVELPHEQNELGASRSYLMGLLPFLLRLLEADALVDKLEQNKDRIPPELNEFQRLLEAAVSMHMRRSKSHLCEVDVSIELSNCERID